MPSSGPASASSTTAALRLAWWSACSSARAHARRPPPREPPAGSPGTYSRNRPRSRASLRSRREPVHRAFEVHLRAHNVARIIYGATIGLALVVALEDHPPAAGVMAGTLV